MQLTLSGSFFTWDVSTPIENGYASSQFSKFAVDSRGAPLQIFDKSKDNAKPHSNLLIIIFNFVRTVEIDPLEFLNKQPALKI